MLQPGREAAVEAGVQRAGGAVEWLSRSWDGRIDVSILAESLKREAGQLRKERPERDRLLADWKGAVRGLFDLIEQ